MLAVRGQILNFIPDPDGVAVFRKLLLRENVYYYKYYPMYKEIIFCIKRKKIKSHLGENWGKAKQYEKSRIGIWPQGCALNFKMFVCLSVYTLESPRVSNPFAFRA